MSSSGQRDAKLISSPAYRLAMGALRRQPLDQEALERAARYLAGCLCEEPWFSKFRDKSGWVYSKLRSKSPKGTAVADLRKAAKVGVESLYIPELRRQLLVDVVAVKTDLAFTLSEIAQDRGGDGPRRWTPNLIQVALALILEARRACQRGDQEFFCSRRDLAPLAGVPERGVSDTVKNLPPTIYGVIDAGSRYAAATYAIPARLFEHLSKTSVADPKLDADELGVVGLLDVLAGSQPKFAPPGWEMQLLSEPLRLERSNKQHRTTLTFVGGRPVANQPRCVQIRPVSWSADQPSSGRRLLDELAEARPCRERLAKNGLPVDVERLKQLLSEHETELGRRDLQSVPPEPAVELPDEDAVPILDPGGLAKLSDERLVHRVGQLRVLSKRVHADGRLRSVWYDGSAKTNRLVSRGSARQGMVCLQNLPKALLSSLIKAPEGQVVLHADFKSMDAFSLAEMSGDEQLRADLQSDVYEALASEHDGERSEWKLSFLLWCYGSGSKGLGETLGITPKEAKHRFRVLRDRYAVASNKLDEFTEHLRASYRTYPSITGYIRAGGWPETVGRNVPVQATSADICRRFEVEVLKLADAEGLGMEPVLSVYDGFWWTVPEEQASAAKGALAEGRSGVRSVLGLASPPDLPL